MSEDELAAIQARVDGLLPIGYLVTALSGAHTPAQVETLTTVLYDDVPALLADVAKLRAQLAAEACIHCGTPLYCSCMRVQT